MFIILRTRDDQVLRVDADILKESNLIRTLLEGCIEEDTEIPLPNVDHEILVEIVNYLHHYQIDPMKPLERPLPMKDFSEIVSPWYYAFINSFEGIGHLYELIKATDYMDIPCIHELACARVASLIRNKEPDEIRRILGIGQDVS